MAVPEEITIRRGSSREQAADIAALHESSDWCYNEANILSEYYEDLFDPTTVIQAEHQGRTIGKLELFIGFKEPPGRFGLISRFVIHPDWRGKGVGKRLLQEAIQAAREAGCAFVELSVEESNSVALNMYLNAGFREERRDYILRLPLNSET